jgi:hypothetical protein
MFRRLRPRGVVIGQGRLMRAKTLGWIGGYQ